MSINCCRNCKYWNNRFAIDNTGKCRRYPPFVLDTSGHNTFPSTFEDEWCGEFEPNKPLDI